MKKQLKVKMLAARNKIRRHKLFEELSTQALAEFDSEVCFRALAATGDKQRGLEILNKLDKHFE
jgi:hypothetical protein